MVNVVPFLQDRSTVQVRVDHLRVHVIIATIWSLKSLNQFPRTCINRWFHPLQFHSYVLFCFLYSVSFCLCSTFVVDPHECYPPLSIREDLPSTNMWTQPTQLRRLVQICTVVNPNRGTFEFELYATVLFEQLYQKHMVSTVPYCTPPSPTLYRWNPWLFYLRLRICVVNCFVSEIAFQTT